MRTLIAEDDAVSRLVLQQAVRKLGHDCLATADGQEAWECLERAEIDVVISDWMMPGIDGVELCRRVRTRTRGTYTYFILLTALGDKEHVLAGLEAGADDYLTKPLDRGELQVRLIAAERVTSLYGTLAAQRTELERLNDALYALARRDPLTDLGNRLGLHEDLDALRSRGEGDDGPWCIALCDIDAFKRYNDTYGHLAGDEVLRAVSGAIARCTRVGDRAYRYGGEEFLLLLPDCSLAAAAVAVEGLRSAVEGLAIPHAGRGEGAVVTISAGVAAFMPGRDAAVEDALRDADAALYHAKATGRNRVVMDDPKSARMPAVAISDVQGMGTTMSDKDR